MILDFKKKEVLSYFSEETLKKGYIVKKKKGQQLNLNDDLIFIFIDGSVEFIYYNELGEEKYINSFSFQDTQFLNFKNLLPKMIKHVFWVASSDCHFWVLKKKHLASEEKIKLSLYMEDLYYRTLEIHVLRNHLSLDLFIANYIYKKFKDGIFEIPSYTQVSKYLSCSRVCLHNSFKKLCEKGVLVKKNKRKYEINETKIKDFIQAVL